MNKLKMLLASSALVAVASFGTVGTAQAALCSTNDVSLTITSTVYHPTNCASNLQQNNNGSDPVTETALLNAAFNTNFSLLARSEPSGNTSGTLNGISFSLAASTFNASSGTFTVNWTDTNGLAPANLPIDLDFAMLINGGSNSDGYLFKDVLLLAPPNNHGTGTFNITFLNNGGNFPDLSHMDLIGGLSATQCPTCAPTPQLDVPEPMTLAIFGTSAMGLMWARRSGKKVSGGKGK